MQLEKTAEILYIKLVVFKRGQHETNNTSVLYGVYHLSLVENQEQGTRLKKGLELFRRND